MLNKKSYNSFFLFCIHLKIWYTKKNVCETGICPGKILHNSCSLYHSDTEIVQFNIFIKLQENVRKFNGNIIYTVCIFFSDLVKYNMKQLRKVLILILHNTFLTPPPPKFVCTLLLLCTTGFFEFFFCKYHFFFSFFKFRFC